MSQQPTTARRHFLRLAGIGAAGSAAAVASVVTGSESAEAATPTQEQSGYRETAHVRQAYATARF